MRRAITNDDEVENAWKKRDVVGVLEARRCWRCFGEAELVWGPGLNSLGGRGRVLVVGELVERTRRRRQSTRRAGELCSCDLLCESPARAFHPHNTSRLAGLGRTDRLHLHLPCSTGTTIHGDEPSWDREMDTHNHGIFTAHPYIPSIFPYIQVRPLSSSRGPAYHSVLLSTAAAMIS